MGDWESVTRSELAPPLWTPQSMTQIESSPLPNSAPTIYMSDAEVDTFLRTSHPALRESVSLEHLQTNSKHGYNARESVSALIDDLNTEEEWLDFEVRLKCSEESVQNRLVKVMLEERNQLYSARHDIINLVESIRHARSELRNAKTRLQSASQYTSSSSEEFLKLDRRKRFLVDALKVVSVLSTLKEIQTRGETALREKDLSGAHQCCRQFDSILLKDAESDPPILSKINCIQSMAAQMTEIAAKTLREMHQNLRELCIDFKPVEYSLLLKAYSELHAHSDLLTRITEEYRTLLNNVLLKYPLLSKELNASNVQKVFKKLLADTVRVFLSLRALIVFHSKSNSDLNLEFNRSLASCLQQLVSETETNLMDILNRSRSAFSALKPVSYLPTHLAIVRMTAFLQLLNPAVNLSDGELAEINSCTPVVQNSLDVAKSCFENMHKQNLEMVRVMLRNESWIRCNVAVKDLYEIRASVAQLSSAPEEFSAYQLRLKVDDYTSAFASRTDIVSENERQDSALFSNLKPISIEGTDLTISLDDIDWAGSRTFTPTSLAILRWLGRYLQFSVVFPSLSVSAAESIADLFLMYTFQVSELCNTRRPVYQLWISEAAKLSSGMFSSGSSQTKVIDHFLDPSQRVALSQLRNRYGSSSQQSIVHDTKPSQKLALNRLCTAIESMSTICVMVEPLGAGLFESCLDKNVRQSQATRLFHSALALAVPIRTGAYSLLSRDIVGAEVLVRMIQQTKSYSQTESRVADSASPFVHLVLQSIAESMTEITTSSNIPPASSEAMTESVCRAALDCVLDGYLLVERCSKEGRAQMLYDNRCLEMELAKICGLVPVPGIERVDAFVKAHLLGVHELVAWVAQHSREHGFSLMHVLSISKSGIGAELPPESFSELVGSVKRAYESQSVDIKLPKSVDKADENENKPQAITSTTWKYDENSAIPDQGVLSQRKEGLESVVELRENEEKSAVFGETIPSEHSEDSQKDTELIETEKNTQSSKAADERIVLDHQDDIQGDAESLKIEDRSVFSSGVLQAEHEKGVESDAESHGNAENTEIFDAKRGARVDDEVIESISEAKEESGTLALNGIDFIEAMNLESSVLDQSDPENQVTEDESPARMSTEEQQRQEEEEAALCFQLNEPDLSFSDSVGIKEADEHEEVISELDTKPQ
mmetsp:Transcript_1095/g.2061  ORF Transcript_1095/g.2061 Transcript_1095/m.2061 type:complete len:1170 (-) Transcript_1095:743-4252(-)